MKVKFKKTHPEAICPTRGSEYAAGYDLYACVDNENEEEAIWPGFTTKINTGIAVEIPEGYFGAIYSRSGLGINCGLRISQGTGIIDADYRGTLIVALYNDSDMKRIIKHGERIAQLIIQPFESVEFEEVNELNETKRGTGGFGSTGK